MWLTYYSLPVYAKEQVGKACAGHVHVPLQHIQQISSLSGRRRDWHRRLYTINRLTTSMDGQINQTRMWVSDKQGSFHGKQALLLPMACAIRMRVLYEERQRWEKSTRMVKCLDTIELHHENARQGEFRRLLSSCAPLIGWNHRPKVRDPRPPELTLSLFVQMHDINERASFAVVDIQTICGVTVKETR